MKPHIIRQWRSEVKDFVINRNSWHFQLNEIFILREKSPHQYPKDFCTYWRWTLWSAVMAGAMTFIVLAAIGAVGIILFGAASHLMFSAALLGFITLAVGVGVFIVLILVPYVIEPLWNKIPRDWFSEKLGKLGDAIALPFVWVWSYLLIPLHYIWELIKEAFFYLNDKYDAWREKHPKKDPKPSIIVAKYKAQKSKICPMVEYA